MSKFFFKLTLTVVLLVTVLAISVPTLALSFNLLSSPITAIAMELGTTGS